MQWTFIAFRKLHRGLTLKTKFMCNSQFAGLKDTYENKKLAMHVHIHKLHNNINRGLLPGYRSKTLKVQNIRQWVSFGLFMNQS